MKEKLRESLFICLVHDVVMLNSFSRSVTAFVEGPVGTRIRKRVKKEALRARERARDAAEDLLRKAVEKITF